MRFGLGCMRLSTDLDRDEERALATIHSALEAGVSILDTAHAYGRDETELGHNERLVARALAGRSASAVRVITKCGMRRDGGAWIPDGRASRILGDARASAAALGNLPIDVLLLHAPDPRTSLATAGRALARARSEGLARRVGASNVSRKQLEELAAHAPITAVEVALGAYDDLPIRSGVVAYCLERGIEIFAHAPLGGPERAPRLARDRLLARLAADHERDAGPASALEIFLAYLVAVRPELVPIVGARSRATVESLVRANGLVLSEEELALLDARFPVLGALRRPPIRGTLAAAEVVLLMGIPGAGKSRAAEELVTRGYERLNRDTLGGTLRGIVRRLDERLAAGATRVVLDNTYVTRATRSDVLRVAHARGATVRCVFFDTPLADAQLNVVLRMIEQLGHVLAPEEIAARSREPTALAPNALHRMTRDLEPPAPDEGFASIEVVPFVRTLKAASRPGVALPLDLAGRDALLERLAAAAPGAPCLLYGWRPAADARFMDEARRFGEEIASASGRVVEVGICPHPAGPPVCWCRPPLPGMWVAFAHRHGIDIGARRD